MLSSKSRSVSLLYSLIAALILLCLSVPAMPQTFFNGIPFDSFIEFAVFCVTLIGVLLRLKERHSGRFGHLKYGKKAIGFLLVVLVLRLISAYGVSSSEGFSSCYRAITAPLDSGDCEKSYEGVFLKGNATRIDPEINFGPVTSGRVGVISGTNWNLPFINEWPRFDLFPYEERYLEKFPFSAVWKGTIDIGSSDQSIPIDYLGSGNVRVDGTDYVLSSSYSELATKNIPVPEGLHEIELKFEFDDTKSSENEPYGEFRVFSPTTNGDRSGAMLHVKQSSLLTSLFAVLLDALALLILVWVLTPALRLLRSRRNIFLVVAVGFIVVSTFSERVPLATLIPATFAYSVCCWGYLYLRRPQDLGVVGIPLAAALGIERMVHFMTLREGYFPGERYAIFRLRGNDWMVYQGLGKSILNSLSLRGGEDVYWGQPGFRYVVALSHFVFGDGDVLIAFFFSSLFIVSIIFLYQSLDDLDSHYHKLFASLLMSLLVMVGVSSHVLEAEYLGLSEYPTWILFIFMASALVGKRRKEWLVLSVAAGAGFCSFVRSNQVFGMFGLMLLVLVMQRPEWFRVRSNRIWQSLALFFAGFLLPLLHNLYYGNKFAVLPESGAANADTTWAQLASALSDPAALSVLVLKVRQLTYTAYLSDQFGWTKTLALVFWSFQIFWIVALIYVLLRHRASIFAWSILVWPYLFAIPALPYRMDAYYPRQVVIFNIALGLSAAAIFLKSSELKKRKSAKFDETSRDKHQSNIFS